MCSEVTAQKGHCTNGEGGILCAGFERRRPTRPHRLRWLAWGCLNGRVRCYPLHDLSTCAR